MQTRCHTSGSFHPDVPETSVLWTFPLAGIRPHCLNKLTIGPTCITWMCVCLYVVFYFLPCLCVHLQKWMNCYNKQLQNTHACVWRSAHEKECVYCCMPACVSVCVCFCVHGTVNIQLPSSPVLVCVLCVRLSWLLALKGAVGGYWAFPAVQVCTLFHSP